MQHLWSKTHIHDVDTTLNSNNINADVTVDCDWRTFLRALGDLLRRPHPTTFRRLNKRSLVV